MVGLKVCGGGQLVPEDRKAIAAYLKPVPLIGNGVRRRSRLAVSCGGGLRLYAYDRSKAGRELIT
jgi:hypothetical protein